MMTRRQAIKTAVVATAACAAGVSAAETSTQAVAGKGFVLPPLPYAYDALEPHIDTLTMQLHHDKHHATYVDNLNKAVASHPELAGKSVEELLRSLASLPENIRTAVRNHGGGHANHSFFWQVMAKGSRPHAMGAMNIALEKKWGTFVGFQSAFSNAALSVFGSGWAWLTIDPSKELRIETTPNQDSPLSEGRTPLVGIDVWEHAYYLKYQNRRPQYIQQFYQVLNWEWVEAQFHRLSA
jgi:Fe-Mn family superoxide dismutase